MLRYSAAGVLDASFDGDGIFTYDAGGTEYVLTLALQADGKILSAGTGPGGGFVGRQNPNGSLDGSFNGFGYVYNNFGTSTVYFDLVQQADGKIVVAGDVQNAGGLDVVVARYTSTGALDASFNGSGYNATSLSAGDDVAYGVTFAGRREDPHRRDGRRRGGQQFHRRPPDQRRCLRQQLQRDRPRGGALCRLCGGRIAGRAGPTGAPWPRAPWAARACPWRASPPAARWMPASAPTACSMRRRLTPKTAPPWRWTPTCRCSTPSSKR